MILRSGNCNYRFRFKLVGVEQLCKVFNEVIIGEEATDNKATQPRNVTLKKFKKKEFLSQQGTAKMHPLLKKAKRLFYKNAEKSVPQDATQGQLLEINSLFGNYSCNYDKLALFKQIFFGKGSIVPLYLEVHCMLYHGAELLAEVARSKKIYFNNNARFDQWIYFENLRY